MATVIVAGKDGSGNGNNWTANNINTTTVGATYDSMTDVPTLTSATASNFATFNPLNIPPQTTNFSNGNLNVTGPVRACAMTTIAPSSGKWYMEFSFSAIGSQTVMVGVSNVLDSNAFYGNAQTWQLIYTQGGLLVNAGSSTSGYATYTTGDVLGLAFDCSTGSATFYKNNTSIGTITNSAFANVPVVFGVGSGGSTGTDTYWGNWGQRPFAYTPPTGYVALNTYNLPTPTIGATATSQANKYMDATLYTGNGSTQTITNSGSFQPDLVWYKSRSNAYGNQLFDAVRGATKNLVSNLTDAEGTNSGVTAFNSNGFSLGSDAGGNQNAATYVGWQWKANGSGSSNTAGSITSTVSANTTSGFSIVTYTGTGSAATVGHGLGVAPSLVIMKRRNAATNWPVWHKNFNATTFLFLQLTNAVSTTENYFNSTLPSSSVISLSANSEVNASGGTYVAYCFAEVAGFSKFGSYTGNGSADGTFIYTGFRPKFIMFKCTSALGHWIMFDSARNTYNVVNNSLRANVSDAENQSYGEYDFTSNGVKIRTTDVGTNGSGSSYIYMAFAENPFKYSLAR